MNSKLKLLLIQLTFFNSILSSLFAGAGLQEITRNKPDQLQFRFNLSVRELNNAADSSMKMINGDKFIKDNSSPIFFLPPSGIVNIQIKIDGKPLSEREVSQFAILKNHGIWRGFHFGGLVFDTTKRPIAGGSVIDVSIAYPSAKAGREIDNFERKVLSNVLNLDYAAYFRERSDKTIVHNSVYQLRERLKIVVRKNGFYRLTIDEISAAGFNVDLSNAAGFHLYNRGLEIPLFIQQADSAVLSPGDAILFYGKRIAGDSTWFNDETEDNIYRLLQDQSPGKRFQEKLSFDTGSVAMYPGFRQRLHFEEDKAYNHGENDQDLYISTIVAGEGWYWRRFGPGSYIQNFVLPNFIESSDPCSLAVYFRGKTSNVLKPNHHLILSVNGHALADTLFSDNADLVLRFAVPSSWLQNGTNSLQISLPGDTEMPNERIDFHWLDVEYTRSFVASSHQLGFSQPAGGTGDSIRYQISNFHENEVHLFDLARSEKIVRVKTSQTGDSFFINFVAEKTDSAHFFAVSAEGLKKPDSIYIDQPSDLKSPGNAADLIIITHKNFEAAAVRLASHRRQHSGLRITVVDIENVYDEFNDGIFGVAAINRFLKYAYANWQSPAPLYVVLFGDGTWDPRKVSGSAVHQTFIPVWGNPVSDNRIVCFDGPDDFLPEMIIGRIAVERADEAEAVVDKIISYDISPVPPFVKKFVFLNGGINNYEQFLFRAQSEELISRYVESDPVAGQPVRIYKNTQGRTVGELQPLILQAFADGLGVFSFSGHAASSTWETMLQNADIPKIQNAGKLPVIFSMTCHTGKFAEPRQVSFAEEFLRLPENGAAAFWGTSGWGWITQDGWLLDGLYRTMARDSVREVGALVTAAKIKLYQSRFEYSGSNVNVIDQYTLFGDPSMQIKLPRQPDFYLSPQAIRTEPVQLRESDSLIVIKIYAENIGLSSVDSTEIALRVFDDSGQPVFSAQKKVGPVGLIDSLSFEWPGSDRRGAYKIEATVNASASVSEQRIDNNSVSQSIYFYSSSLTIAKPKPLTQIAENRPTLYVYNPELAGQETSIYEFEIDTIETFSSPYLLQSGSVDEQKVRTGWKVTKTLTNGLHYWRCRRVTASSQSRWEEASFWLESAGVQQAFRQSGIFWPAENITYASSNDGITLPLDESKTRILQVRSLGFWQGTGHCDLIIDGLKVNFNNDLRGHNFVALAPVSQEIISGPLNFDTYASPAAADSMADILENLPPRTVLLIGIHDEGSVSMTVRAQQAITQFGSARIAEIGFRDSWGMIGIKGMAPGQAAEVLLKNGLGQAVANDTLRQYKTVGELSSNAIGPALAWGELQVKKALRHLVYTNSTSPEASSTVFVDGRAGKNGSWLPITQFQNIGTLSLSNVPATSYPYIRLRALFEDDDGLDSSLLEKWLLGFQPAGDIVIDPASLHLAQDSLLAGEMMQLSATMYVFDELATDSVTAGLYRVKDDAGLQLLQRHKIKIPDNDIYDFIFNFSLQTQGKNRLRISVDDMNIIPEMSEQNNFYEIDAFIARDAQAPEVRILVDDREIIDDDFVSSAPVIICDIFDESPAAIRDTSSFIIKLDNRQVYFNTPDNRLDFQPIQEGQLRARLLFQPQLKPGEHLLTVQVSDIFGYHSTKSVKMRIAEKFTLQQVMNYPNPFENETEFTFFLTQEAQSVIIKIFTVAGRLIRTVEDFSPKIGFNQVYWNGRDEDYDLLANGVYLFKIIARSEGKTAEFIGKVAIAR